MKKTLISITFLFGALATSTSNASYFDAPKGFKQECYWLNDTDVISKNKADQEILTKISVGHCETDNVVVRGLRWYKKGKQTCVETVSKTVITADRGGRSIYAVPQKVSACF